MPTQHATWEQWENEQREEALARSNNREWAEQPLRSGLSIPTQQYLQMIKHKIKQWATKEEDHQIQDRLTLLMFVEVFLTLGDLRNLLVQATRYIRAKRGLVN